MFVQVGIDHYEIQQIAFVEEVSTGIKVHVGGQGQNAFIRTAEDVEAITSELNKAKSFVKYGTFWINKTMITMVHENTNTLMVMFDWPNSREGSYTLYVPRMENDLLLLGVKKK